VLEGKYFCWHVWIAPDYHASNVIWLCTEAHLDLVELHLYVCLLNLNKEIAASLSNRCTRGYDISFPTWPESSGYRKSWACSLPRGGGHCGGWGYRVPAGTLPSQVPWHPSRDQATSERGKSATGWLIGLRTNYPPGELLSREVSAYQVGTRRDSTPPTHGVEHG
jgi:hypothetical protein